MKVVFLGCTDNYGYGFSANVTKIGYVAKGLKEAGANCVIHNGIIGSRSVQQQLTTTIDGFQVTTLKKHGHEIFSWIFNMRKIYKYLKSMKEPNKKNIAIIEWDMYHIFLIYYILCKITGYKLATITHEWGPIVVGVNKLRKPSVLLYAKTFGWFVDAILPISEYIIKKTEHFKKPYFKLPILADFNENNNDNNINNEERNCFVYCASVFYKRIIIMIIKAYKIYKEENGKLNLTLILNGPEDKINEIQEEINNIKLQEYITIKTKLPYKQLLKEYAESAALIIPLDPECEQDEARFSQKISEYLSAKAPIITNNVGEIKYYFTNDELLKCDYNEESYSKTFHWVELNKEESYKIGINGYKKGLKEFDYKSKGKELYQFLGNLFSTVNN